MEVDLKRALIAALALALLVPAGVAAQEATPVPSPGYAPDDVADALPTSVGDFEMSVWHFDVGYRPTDEDYDDAWRDVLVPLRKDPMDVRYAIADGYDGRTVFIHMALIDGVPAVDEWEGVWRAKFPEGFGAPVDVEWEWQDIAGRRVAEGDYRLVGDDFDVAFTDYVYPKGEALFIITTWADPGVEPLPIEDILAELP